MHPVSRLCSAAMALSVLWLGGSVSFGAGEGNPLIVPGKSVGEIELGTKRLKVQAKLGKPVTGEGATGRAWDAWFAPREGGGRGYELDVRSHASATSNDKVVEAVRVESPFFRTKDGINTGSSLANIWKVFPGAHYSFSDQHDQAVEIYEDDAHGIAFEVRRTFTSAGSVPPPGASWGACQAIIVFAEASGNDENTGMPPISSMRSMPNAD